MKKFPPVPFFISSIALIVVAVLTTLYPTCPICGGSGVLKAAQGLVVKDTSIQLLDQVPVFTFGACGVPQQMAKFTYAVNMTLTNNSSSETKGTVKVVFSQHPPGFQTFVMDLEGNLQAVDYMPPSVPAYVDVPAGQTKVIHVNLTYTDNPLVAGEAGAQVSITPGEDLTDPTCGGTGKLSFAKWIAAKLQPPSFH
jgi:hypothetical protein